MTKPTILIVEDDRIIAQEIKSRLVRVGYSVAATVFSGEMAIKKAKEFQPDLVLMDIKLEGEMDGIEAAQHIREQFNIPVVFLTAYGDENTVKRAKVSEPYGFIVKPVIDRDIFMTIEMALYKHDIEKGLREQKQWFSTILKGIADGVIATNKDGFVKFMNPTAERLTGWRQEEAIGKDLKDVFKCIREKTKKRQDSTLRTVRIDGVIIRRSDDIILIAKDGSKVPIDEIIAPITDDRGNNVGITTLFRDITDRKMAEQARVLKESEELFRDFFEKSSLGMYRTTPDGRILMANPSLINMLGYTTIEELTSRNLNLEKDWYEPDYPRSDFLTRIELEGFVKGLESAWKSKDGSVLYLRENAQAIKGKDGRTKYYQGTIEDISDRKKTQEELSIKHAETLRLQAFLEDIMNSMTTGLIVTNTTGHVLIVNPSGQKTLGVIGKDVLGRHIEEIAPDLSPFLHTNQKKDTLGEISVRCPDGRVIPLGFTSTYFFDADGQKRGILSIFKDLTEIVDMRKKIRSKEKLSTIGEIARGIAHEIKNPIFAISSGIQVLQFEMDLKDDQKETLDIIFEETMRVDRLVKQLLNFSLKPDLNLSDVRIEKLIDEVITLNKGLLQSKCIQVRKKIQPDMPSFSGDKDKIKQVMINIMQNAIDELKEDDIIEISSSCDNKDKTIFIKIADNGPGIPEEHRNKVFDIFFSSKKGGCGLGLALSKKIIHEHMGDIMIEDNSYGGATFVITLPVRV